MRPEGQGVAAYGFILSIVDSYRRYLQRERFTAFDTVAHDNANEIRSANQLET